MKIDLGSIFTLSSKFTVLRQLCDLGPHDRGSPDREFPLELGSPLSPGSGIHALQVDRASIVQGCKRQLHGGFVAP